MAGVHEIGLRTQNIVMLEHDSRIDHHDVVAVASFLNDQELLCVDVMIEKIGFRLLCNVEGLKLHDTDD